MSLEKIREFPEIANELFRNRQTTDEFRAAEVWLVFSTLDWFDGWLVGRLNLE
jgi:hypothetical protein